MRRLLAFVPLVILAIIALGAGYLLLRGEPRAEHFEASLNRPAPNFDLASLDGGGRVRAEAFSGRAYAINIFASWCAPCRTEHPLLMRLAQEGVIIVGVAYRDEPEAARGFLQRLGDPFAARALDPEGAFAIDLGFTGAPETYVINAEGRIVAVHRGALSESVIARVIRPALAGGAASASVQR